MTDLPRLVSVVGARPQFIKAASVTRALRADGVLEEVMIHTGQHFDPEMSEVFFQELAIPAARYNLDIHGGGHGQMTGRMLEKIETVLETERPVAVLVYGDTNSTLAGALAAAKLNIPVAHVEAGLRSFNRSMPEETNRVLTDHVSDLLLCPTTTAVSNLRNEGITDGVVHCGDVMYDASLFALERARDSSDVLSRMGLVEGGYSLATVHRAENTAEREQLAAVLDYLKREAEQRPVVFPVHPRTRAAARHHGLDFDGLEVCEPLGYLDVTLLTAHAACVFTDSGGLQKEAYFHRTPCVTLRGETEWVETVAAGWNRLWKGEDFAPRVAIDEYGDGRAAERVADLLQGRYAR